MEATMTRQTTRAALTNIVHVATGGDPVAVGRLRRKIIGHPATVGDVLDLLRESGIWRLSVLREDIERAFQGREPVAFLPARTMAKRYRNRRGVRPRWKQREDTVFRSGDIADVLEETWQQDRKEREKYGGTQLMYRLGLACPNEQDAFYDSDEWSLRAKAARAAYGVRCSQCGEDDAPIEVHHQNPIYSAYSKQFQKNFELARMRPMCRPCHQEWHQDRQKEHHGFRWLRGEGKDREQLQAANRAHDGEGLCEWCKHHEEEVSDGLPF